MPYIPTVKVRELELDSKKYFAALKKESQEYDFTTNSVTLTQEKALSLNVDQHLFDKTNPLFRYLQRLRYQKIVPLYPQLAPETLERLFWQKSKRYVESFGNLGIAIEKSRISIGNKKYIETLDALLTVTKFSDSVPGDISASVTSDAKLAQSVCPLEPLDYKKFSPFLQVWEDTAYKPLPPNLGLLAYCLYKFGRGTVVLAMLNATQSTSTGLSTTSNTSFNPNVSLVPSTSLPSPLPLPSTTVIPELTAEQKFVELGFDQRKDLLAAAVSEMSPYLLQVLGSAVAQVADKVKDPQELPTALLENLQVLTATIVEEVDPAARWAIRVLFNTKPSVVSLAPEMKSSDRSKQFAVEFWQDIMTVTGLEEALARQAAILKWIELNQSWFLDMAAAASQQNPSLCGDAAWRPYWKFLEQLVQAEGWQPHNMRMRLIRVLNKNAGEDGEQGVVDNYIVRCAIGFSEYRLLSESGAEPSIRKTAAPVDLALDIHFSNPPFSMKIRAAELWLTSKDAQALKLSFSYPTEPAPAVVSLQEIRIAEVEEAPVLTSGPLLDVLNRPAAADEQAKAKPIDEDDFIYSFLRDLGTAIAENKPSKREFSDRIVPWFSAIVDNMFKAIDPGSLDKSFLYAKSACLDKLIAECFGSSLSVVDKERNYVLPKPGSKPPYICELVYTYKTYLRQEGEEDPVRKDFSPPIKLTIEIIINPSPIASSSGTLKQENFITARVKSLQITKEQAKLLRLQDYLPEWFDPAECKAAVLWRQFKLDNIVLPPIESPAGGMQPAADQELVERYLNNPLSSFKALNDLTKMMRYASLAISQKTQLLQDIHELYQQVQQQCLEAHYKRVASMLSPPLPSALLELLFWTHVRWCLATDYTRSQTAERAKTSVATQDGAKDYAHFSGQLGSWGASFSESERQLLYGAFLSSINNILIQLEKRSKATPRPRLFSDPVAAPPPETTEQGSGPSPSSLLARAFRRKSVGEVKTTASAPPLLLSDQLVKSLATALATLEPSSSESVRTEDRWVQLANQQVKQSYREVATSVLTLPPLAPPEHKTAQPVRKKSQETDISFSSLLNAARFSSWSVTAAFQKVEARLIAPLDHTPGKLSAEKDSKSQQKVAVDLERYANQIDPREAVLIIQGEEFLRLGTTGEKSYLISELENALQLQGVPELLVNHIVRNIHGGGYGGLFNGFFYTSLAEQGINIKLNTKKLRIGYDKSRQVVTLIEESQTNAPIFTPSGTISAESAATPGGSSPLLGLGGVCELALENNQPKCSIVAAVVFAYAHEQSIKAKVVDVFQSPPKKVGAGLQRVTSQFLKKVGARPRSQSESTPSIDLSDLQRSLEKDFKRLESLKAEIGERDLISKEHSLIHQYLENKRLSGLMQIVFSPEVTKEARIKLWETYQNNYQRCLYIYAAQRETPFAEETLDNLLFWHQIQVWSHVFSQPGTVDDFAKAEKFTAEFKAVENLPGRYKKLLSAIFYKSNSHVTWPGTAPVEARSITTTSMEASGEEADTVSFKLLRPHDSKEKKSDTLRRRMRASAPRGSQENEGTELSSMGVDTKRIKEKKWVAALVDIIKSASEMEVIKKLIELGREQSKELLSKVLANDTVQNGGALPPIDTSIALIGIYEEDLRDEAKPGLELNELQPEPLQLYLNNKRQFLGIPVKLLGAEVGERFHTLQDDRFELTQYYFHREFRYPILLQVVIERKNNQTTWVWQLQVSQWDALVKRLDDKLSPASATYRWLQRQRIMQLILNKDDWKQPFLSSTPSGSPKPPLSRLTSASNTPSGSPKLSAIQLPAGRSSSAPAEFSKLPTSRLADRTSSVSSFFELSKSSTIDAPLEHTPLSVPLPVSMERASSDSPTLPVARLTRGSSGSRKSVKPIFLPIPFPRVEGGFENEQATALAPEEKWVLLIGELAKACFSSPSETSGGATPRQQVQLENTLCWFPQQLQNAWLYLDVTDVLNLEKSFRVERNPSGKMLSVYYTRWRPKSTDVEPGKDIGDYRPDQTNNLELPVEAQFQIDRLTSKISLLRVKIARNDAVRLGLLPSSLKPKSSAEKALSRTPLLTEYRFWAELHRQLILREKAWELITTAARENKSVTEKPSKTVKELRKAVVNSAKALPSAPLPLNGEEQETEGRSDDSIVERKEVDDANALQSALDDFNLSPAYYSEEDSSPSHSAPPKGYRPRQASADTATSHSEVHPKLKLNPDLKNFIQQQIKQALTQNQSAAWLKNLLEFVVARAQEVTPYAYDRSLPIIGKLNAFLEKLQNDYKAMSAVTLPSDQITVLSAPYLTFSLQEVVEEEKSEVSNRSHFSQLSRLVNNLGKSSLPFSQSEALTYAACRQHDSNRQMALRLTVAAMGQALDPGRYLQHIETQLGEKLSPGVDLIQCARMERVFWQQLQWHVCWPSYAIYYLFEPVLKTAEGYPQLHPRADMENAILKDPDYALFVSDLPPKSSDDDEGRLQLYGLFQASLQQAIATEENPSPETKQLLREIVVKQLLGRLQAQKAEDDKLRDIGALTVERSQALAGFFIVPLTPSTPGSASSNSSQGKSNFFTSTPSPSPSPSSLEQLPSVSPSLVPPVLSPLPSPPDSLSQEPKTGGETGGGLKVSS